jgi:putative cell wall-binding protein
VHSSPSRGRAAAALATGLTAAVAFSALTALPASATTAPAETEPLAAVTTGTVSDAVFQWGINNESNNSAFFGFNYLSAGKIAKTSGDDQLTEAEWKATDGAVTIQKKQADGSYATSTWAGLRTTAAGGSLGAPGSPNYSDNRVSITGGTGTVDADDDNAEITWDGDFTVAFYNGFTQFSATDPHLSVENGVGTVTATLSGYGTVMGNESVFSVLPEAEVVLANLGSVDVTETGFTVTPDYLGVTAPSREGSTPQKTTDGATFGSFPESFVSYQFDTGQSSYWYSSGLNDAGKPALPFTTGYTVQAPVATPQVSVSKTEGLNPDTDVVTVTGTGFSPNAPATSGTRPPLAGKFGGAYVAFGSFADVWKPSEGAPRGSRTTADTKWVLEAADVATVGGAAAGAVAINADGSFQVDITVNKDFAGALADGNYGIYTYPGSGAVYAPFETYTPISFGAAVPTRIEGADRYDVAVRIAQQSHPTTSDVVYLANGTTFTDALSAAPAAASDSAPLLLTTSDTLLPEVLAELERLKPKTVVVVGGPKSIQPAVFDQIDAIATEEAVRIDGADRYAVSQSVADYAFAEGATTAYVATGTNFPDALSASAAAGSNGYPVVLVYGKAGTADAATKTLLTDLGVQTVKIAGGPASVSAGIATSLGSVAPVTRLSGADRYQASIAINRDAFAAADDVFIATGLKFPDALAGAVLAASKDAPLYVVPAGCVPTGVIQDIGTFAPNRVTLLGGTASLSPAVQSLTACAF